MIRADNTQVKVEVNTVLRGTIFEPVEKEVHSNIQDEFELFATIQTLSLEDLYGGKICAALDRQHPRDLFDIKLLLENEGLTQKIRTAFIGYLISHSRPIYEIVNPNRLDLTGIYKNEFVGMTNESVPLEALVKVQEQLPKILLGDLTDEEKEFILSFQKLKPQWDLMPMLHLKDLPGVQWKLINIDKMDQQKHQEMGKKLKKVLAGDS